jgi:hypothetical protein
MMTFFTKYGLIVLDSVQFEKRGGRQGQSLCSERKEVPQSFIAQITNKVHLSELEGNRK